MNERDKLNKKLIKLYLKMVGHSSCLSGDETGEELINADEDDVRCFALPSARKWSEKQLMKHYQV